MYQLIQTCSFLPQFQEDLTYRHLEPALAFQLELNRMRLFNLKPIPCANKNLHIYYGAAKKVGKQFLLSSFFFNYLFGVNLYCSTSYSVVVQEGRQREVTDYRFFIRSIVRHSDFVTKVCSIHFIAIFCRKSHPEWQLNTFSLAVLKQHCIRKAI